MERLDGIAVETTPVARVGFRLVQEQYGLSSPQELDVFTSLYEPDPILQQSVDEEHIPWHRAVGEMMGSAVYQSVHTSTVLDEELAGVGVRPIMDELQSLEEKFRKLEQQRREAQESLDIEQHARLEQLERLTRAEATQAVARAVSQAREAMETVMALRAMGYGTEAGRYLSLNYHEIPRIVDLVKRTYRHFGRFREMFATARAGVPRRAVTVRGVTVGDELHRATSSQLGLLADSDTEPLFYQRWLEKRLLIRDVNRPPEKRRGDVVVLVDESGSMEGEAILIAKAYVFALRAQLKQENRKCHIVSFSYRAEDMVELPDDATAEQVIEWLGRMIGGGTDFMKPLEYAKQFHRDILMITDGDAEVDEEFQREFIRWKRETGNRLFLIHIGTSPTLNDLADSVLVSEDAYGLWAQLVG